MASVHPFFTQMTKTKTPAPAPAPAPAPEPKAELPADVERAWVVLHSVHSFTARELAKRAGLEKHRTNQIVYAYPGLFARVGKQGNAPLWACAKRVPIPSLPSEDDKFKWEQDDKGVACRYTKATGEWDPMEPEAGSEPEDE